MNNLHRDYNYWYYRNKQYNVHWRKVSKGPSYISTKHDERDVAEQEGCIVLISLHTHAPPARATIDIAYQINPRTIWIAILGIQNGRSVPTQHARIRSSVHKMHVWLL